jgi:DNA polymerase-3 subunit beta
MKIGTTKELLLTAALIAERITGKKESLPVLSCVYLDAQKTLSVQATNLEAGIELAVAADVEEKGSVAVPAAILAQTIRSIGGEKVALRTEEGNLLVESRGTKTLIKAIPHDEFPKLPRPSGARGTSLAREKLLRGIQSTLYAASSSMIRPELGSIYVNIKRAGVVFVATDSFRLAEKTLVGAAGNDGGEVLIPLKHANEIAYVLERLPEESVELSVEDSQLVLTCGETRFVSRVVDAQFPAYKEIIPKDFIAEATMLKADFAEMLKKARVFAGADQHVGLHLYPKKKIFSATARSSDVGEMSDSIDAAISGEDLDINFHIGYLGDCLSSIESDSITLSFAGVGRPLVIKGVSDASFLYLVMPLNR